MKPIDLRAEWLMPVTVELKTEAPVMGEGFYKWPVVITGKPYHDAPFDSPDGEPELLRKELSLNVDQKLYAQFLDQKGGAGDKFKLVPMDAGAGVVWFAVKEYESVAKLDQRVSTIKKELEEKYAKRLDEVEALLNTRSEELEQLKRDVTQMRTALLGREKTKNEAKDVAEMRNKIRKGFEGTKLPGDQHAKAIERLLGRRIGLDGIDDLGELDFIYKTALRVHYQKTTWDEVLNGTYSRSHKPQPAMDAGWNQLEPSGTYAH